jgi:hypothetical protein
MKKICILAAAIAVAASPAFAQSRRAHPQRAPQVSSDPYGAQKRYTDPDPNVQFEIMRQQNWRKGG